MSDSTPSWCSVSCGVVGGETSAMCQKHWERLHPRVVGTTRSFIFDTSAQPFSAVRRGILFDAVHTTENITACGPMLRSANSIASEESAILLRAASSCRWFEFWMLRAPSSSDHRMSSIALVQRLPFRGIFSTISRAASSQAFSKMPMTPASVLFLSPGTAWVLDCFIAV